MRASAVEAGDGPADAVPAASTRRQPSFWRSVVAVAATALLMLVVDYAVSSATIVALFSGSLPGIAITVVVGFLVLSGSVIAVCAAITGRRTIVGAVAVTALLTAVGAYGFATGILSPLPMQVDVLRHLAVCGMSAAALGVFLGPWPLRLLGAAAAAGLIALLLLTPTPAETATAERAQQRVDDLDAARSAFLASARFPLVTDLPGWSTVEVRATGSDAATWMRSDSGAVARVIVQWDVPNPDPHAPCNLIGGPGLDWDRGFEEFPSWCVRTGDQWARADGTAVYVLDAGTALWIIGLDGYDAERVGGTTAADAEDIALLIPSLHPMARTDVETHILPTYDGINSPEVRLPGF
ncbi:hypothetical protein AB0N73_05325 [Microbacterium sp. NPDC089189]|uniref:hypothetical protein n=1 Tax=Microbacterium sp. NPDC089189 TaxID=3154972 RepID=UPI00342B84DD